MKLRSRSLWLSALFTACMLSARLVSATTWSGASGIDLNWSTFGNWLETTSPEGTDVIFDGTGSVGAAGTINNIVDNNHNVNSLLFTNGPSEFHTTSIPAGMTLNISGNLTVGQSSAVNNPSTRVDFTGEGTLVQSAGNVTVKNFGAASTGGFATLDLSGLSNFIYDVPAATLNVSGSGGNARAAGVLTLAGNSNYINVATITIATGTGNGGPGGSALNLGTGTNIINVANLNLVAGKVNTASIKFSGETGGLRMRGAGGTDEDRVTMVIANRNNSGTGTPVGTLDLTGGHPFDIKAGTITIGQGASGAAGTAVRGILQFDTGTIDATAINLAMNSDADVTTTATVTVGGGGTLIVEDMSLVNQIVGVATGNLNIGGNAIFSGSIVKTTSDGVGNITITNGTLVVAGTIGADGNPVDSFNVTNGVMTLASGNSPTVNASALNVGDPTNKISISSVPTVSGYPAQLPLIVYTTSSGDLDSLVIGNLPSPYVGFLSNNVANNSIDLVLTAGIAPARTVTWTGTPSGDWDVANTANWLFNGGVSVYNQNDFVLFDDSASGTTTVNLTTTLTPSSITVSNASKSYSFTGGGSISGVSGLTKEGSGTLVVANSGVNDFIGSVVIDGGTVQVGNADSTGNLGAGSVNNNASLVFNRIDDFTVANSISGTGSVAHNGPGILTLSGANSFEGALTVSQGTLKTDTGTALGSIDGSTTISEGATLDINAQNLGAEPVTAQGVGSGMGALVNMGAQQLNALRYVTLSGDTTVGGFGRWDIRSNNTGNPAGAALNTGSNPYNLTKLGFSQFSLVGVTVDPMLGNINVLEGTFAIETATTGAGDPTKTLTVADGARLQFHNMTNHLDKIIVLNGNGFNETLRNNAGASTVIGPITVNGPCILAVAGTSLNLNNIDGTGSINKSGAAPLILSGTSSPDGGITINEGTLVLNGAVNSALNILSGTTLTGTGASHSTVDVSGTLNPGSVNGAGTFTAAGGLTLNGNLVMDLTSTNTANGGVNDLLNVGGDLTANGTMITINLLQGSLQPGTYRLINYTNNLVGEFLGVAGGGQSRFTFTLDTSVAGQVNLIVSGSSARLKWNSTASTVWDVAGTANWLNIAGGTNDFFYSGDPVLLDDTVGVTNTLTIDAGVSVSPSAITNISSANNFTISGAGSITGGASIFKDGDSTLTLDTTNNFTGTVHVEEGTLKVSNNGSLGALPGGAVTITNGATLDLGGNPTANNANYGAKQFNIAGAGVDGAGVIVNSGAVQQLNAFQNVVLTADATIGGPGDAAATGNPGRWDIRGGTPTLDLGGFTLTKVGLNQITLVGVAVNSGNIVVNQGIFSAETTTSFTEDGTITVNSDGTLGHFRNNAGSFTRPVVLNGGTIRNLAGSGAETVNDAPITLTANSTLFGSGTAGYPITFNGAISGSFGITKIGAGGVILTAPSTYSGSTLINAGTLTLSGAGAIANSSEIVLETGTILDVAGRTDGTLVLSSGTTLRGNGTVTGILDAGSGSTVSPGVAEGTIGVLTVSGAVTLSGTTAMNIDATVPANDLITTTGNITYGGVLNVAVTGTPNANDTFKLFNAGTYSGSFSSITPQPGAGLEWDASLLTSSGTLRVIAVTGVSFTETRISGNNLITSGANGTPNGTYHLLTSTNIAQPVGEWEVIATNLFDATGNFSSTNQIDPQAPARFFMIQVPVP